MILTVTQVQLSQVKTALGAQVIVIYSMVSADPTKVEAVLLLDSKAGQLHLSFTDPAEQPSETAFLVSHPGAIKVIAIG